jgi:hypothetical protein
MLLLMPMGASLCSSTVPSISNPEELSFPLAFNLLLVLNPHLEFAWCCRTFDIQLFLASVARRGQQTLLWSKGFSDSQDFGMCGGFGASWEIESTS